jgi:competence protein ComEA
MMKKIVALAAALFAVAAWAAVDVNKATDAELDSVKGVGPALSKRILDARKEAPFKDWPDFMSRVKGVKEKSATKLSAEGLTVNGQAFGAAAAPAQVAAKEVKAEPKKAAAGTAKASAKP